MVTVRLLVGNLQGELVEVDADVVLNATFEQNLTDLLVALTGEFLTVLRIELPGHIFTDCQTFLIPSMEGIVTLDRRVPAA